MNRDRMLMGLFVLLIALAVQAQDSGTANESVETEDSAATGQPLSAESSEASAGAEIPLDVEAILTTPSETEYTESPRCLSTARIRRTEVLDERHIVFHMSRDKFLLVQFPHRCPTLDKNSALMYDVQGSRLCQLNWVRAVNGAGMSRSIGPICMIPGFQEISVEQVLLIRESLDELRRKRRTGPESPPEKDTPDDSGVDMEQGSEPS